MFQEYGHVARGNESAWLSGASIPSCDCVAELFMCLSNTTSGPGYQGAKNMQLFLACTPSLDG